MPAARATEEFRARQEQARGEADQLFEQLAVVERKIKRLLDQIESGHGEIRSITSRLVERENERDQLRSRIDLLSTDAPRPLELPDFAAAYAAQVQSLERLLSQEDFVQRTHEALARLITKIVLIPDPTDPDGHRIEVHGDLARLLSVCFSPGGKSLPADLLDLARQLTLVAGVGFEPTTFRL